MTAPVNAARERNENISFLRVLLSSFSFLAVSALILTTGFLTFYPHFAQKEHGRNESANTSTSQPKSFPGKDLLPILGKGRVTNDSFLLTQLTKEYTQAIVSTGRIDMEAGHYPILQYSIDNRQPGIKIEFFWRTATNPNTITTTPLYWSGNGETFFNLSKEKKWKGKIIEIGLSVYGDLRGQPVNINKLWLRPFSRSALLSTIWSEWTAFEGWKQHSINFVVGSAPNSIISPVVAAAAWCGLSILLYVFWIISASIKTLCSSTVHFPNPIRGTSGDASRPPGLKSLGATISERSRATKSPQSGTSHSLRADPLKAVRAIYCLTKENLDYRVSIAIFLVTWLSLDFRWQTELFRQLADTYYLYAGKTFDEKRLAAEDGELYAYIKHLKMNILPKQPTRIFILHDSSGHNYWRLRAQYHLLPHNIYNYGRYPQPEYLRNGDRILVLGKINGLHYNTQNKTLYWGEGHSLSFHLEDSSQVGTLYLYRK